MKDWLQYGYKILITFSPRYWVTSLYYPISWLWFYYSDAKCKNIRRNALSFLLVCDCLLMLCAINLVLFLSGGGSEMEWAPSRPLTPWRQVKEKTNCGLLQCCVLQCVFFRLRLALWWWVLQTTSSPASPCGTLTVFNVLREDILWFQKFNSSETDKNDLFIRNRQNKILFWGAGEFTYPTTPIQGLLSCVRCPISFLFYPL